MSRGAGEKLFPSMPRGLAMFVRGKYILTSVSAWASLSWLRAGDISATKWETSTSLALRKP